MLPDELSLYKKWKTSSKSKHGDGHKPRGSMASSVESQHGIEMTDHGMLSLSETNQSLEHLANSGHPSTPALADLSRIRSTPEQLDNSATPRSQNDDAIGNINDSNLSIRSINRDRDVGLGGVSNGSVSSSGTLSHSLSSLVSTDRHREHLRNLSLVAERAHVLENSSSSLSNSINHDSRNGLSSIQDRQNHSIRRNNLQDHNGHSSLSFNHETSSRSLLDHRGRPPSIGPLGLDQPSLSQGLSEQHLRSLSERNHHGQQSVVDHRPQNLSDINGNGPNDRDLSAYGLETGGQMHSSRPSSILPSDPNSRSESRGLPQDVYSSSIARSQSTSLIEQTIAEVASNLSKSANGPLSSIPPGPHPFGGLSGQAGGNLVMSRPGSHMGMHGDDSLVDLVGRHGNHSIPLLSERASQSLTGLMDDSVLHHPPGSVSPGGHGSLPEKTHPCLTCLKLFRSKQQLAQHSLVHTGIRKHVCSYCDRAFKQLSHLQQHVRIHTGEKPYRCKFEGCERAFAQLSNLQHHMRNHEDQVKKEATRIHKCQICHRCYTNESSLKSHTLKMHIHIKPIDQITPPGMKKKHKRKKEYFGDIPSMVPSSSEGLTASEAALLKVGSSRNRSPTSSEDEDEIIFVGEQMGPLRGENFPPGLGGQGQMLPGAGRDLGHQIPFSSMGSFSRGADPIALLASANRFSLQDNMMTGLGGPLNSFSDQLAFRDAALLNRFNDLRSGAPQAGFDDRFGSSNFNHQNPQRDRDFNDNGRNIGNSSAQSTSSSGGSSSGGDEGRNQIPAHNQGLLRGAGVSGMMGGTQGLGGLMKQIKQEPLDYFPSSCHGGEQYGGMGTGAGGFLSPQHLLNSHLRGPLPTLSVPLIREHFSHNQMLPPASSTSSSTPPASSSTNTASTSSSSNPSSSASTLLQPPSSSTPSLPLPLTHMGLYHNSHFPSSQRMSGLHPVPSSTPSGQLSIGSSLPSNLSTQGTRSPLEQEDLRCFSPLRN